VARGTNLDRVRDIQAALKRAKPGDELSLAECAMIWGVSKGSFINRREQMAKFPNAKPGAGNSLLYPAQAALRAMLEHETRADEAERERQTRAAAIMGMSGGRGRRKVEEVFLAPSEMLKLSRLRAEIEQREREQGLYAPIADLRNLLASVFGTLSETLGRLELKADPNGLWEADVRQAVQAAGRECLLLIHAQVSDMLGPDADNGPPRTKKPRGAASGSGLAPP
jgi:hypothetical protein